MTRTILRLKRTALLEIKAEYCDSDYEEDRVLCKEVILGAISFGERSAEDNPLFRLCYAMMAQALKDLTHLQYRAEVYRWMLGKEHGMCLDFDLVCSSLHLEKTAVLKVTKRKWFDKKSLNGNGNGRH